MPTEDAAAPVTEPEPRDSAPTYLTEDLGKQDADTLRELADYARRLAKYRAAQATADIEEQATEFDGTPDGVGRRRGME